MTVQTIVARSDQYPAGEDNQPGQRDFRMLKTQAGRCRHGVCPDPPEAGHGEQVGSPTRADKDENYSDCVGRAGEKDVCEGDAVVGFLLVPAIDRPIRVCHRLSSQHIDLPAPDDQREDPNQRQQDVEGYLRQYRELHGFFPPASRRPLVDVIHGRSRFARLASWQKEGSTVQSLLWHRL